MPLDAPSLSHLSRRRFLQVGLAGAAALACARWLYGPVSNAPQLPREMLWLDERRRIIVAAIVPAMLAGALPSNADSATVRDEVISGVDHAIAGLPPAVREEMSELFALLAFAPARCIVAGVWSSWDKATSVDVSGFLERWRNSRFALLHSAYDALHQIIYAAWYGNPHAWTAIGYAGPPTGGSA
jgi:hypothetical protein